MPSALYNRHSDLVRGFSEQGFYLQHEVLQPACIKELKMALHQAIQSESLLHRASDDDMQVVCCPWYDDIFLHALRDNVFNDANKLLGNDCILYNYNNSSIKPHTGNFSSHIHVERYYTTGRQLEGVGVIILLDDFTIENGASWFLPSSWPMETAPDEEYFFSTAERLIAPAGSVLFFHPHLWHCGGVNQTAHFRHALSIGFCKPYLKQRLDLTELFSDRRSRLPEDIVQKLGFHSLPPKSIEAFYNRPGGWAIKTDRTP